MAGDETALVMASLTSAPAHNPVSGRSATRLSCLNGCLHVALRLPGVLYVTCTQIYVSLSSSIHRAAARDEATEMSDTLNPASCLDPSDRHQARYCGVCARHGLSSPSLPGPSQRLPEKHGRARNEVSKVQRSSQCVDTLTL